MNESGPNNKVMLELEEFPKFLADRGFIFDGANETSSAFTKLALGRKMNEITPNITQVEEYLMLILVVRTGENYQLGLRIGNRDAVGESFNEADFIVKLDEFENRLSNSQ